MQYMMTRDTINPRCCLVIVRLCWLAKTMCCLLAFPLLIVYFWEHLANEWCECSNETCASVCFTNSINRPEQTVWYEKTLKRAGNATAYNCAHLLQTKWSQLTDVKAPTVAQPACRPVCGFTFPSTTEMSKQCLVFSSSHSPPSLPLHPPLLPHRSVLPRRPQDSLCFWSSSDSDPDNLSTSVHSPRPRGGKRGLLLPSLFASSSDVLEKTIGRQGEGRRKGFRPTCFIKCWSPGLKQLAF